MVGFDTNETFDFDVDEIGRVAITAKSARGEAILECEQEATKATYYPYNTNQRPRRLDYIWTRGIPISEEKVVEKCRVLLGFDHDAVRLKAKRTRQTNTQEKRPLRKEGAFNRDTTLDLEVGEMRTRATVETIQEVSRRITQQVRRPRGWKESDELKQPRTHARSGPIAQRRDAWKRVWKMHKLERRQYNDELCSRALRRDWTALRSCQLPPVRALPRHLHKAGRRGPSSVVPEAHDSTRLYVQQNSGVAIPGV